MLIAQISDTHIVRKNAHWQDEPATEIAERLKKAVAYLNQMHPRPDVVLLTGDATDEGDRPAYLHLRELLAPLQIPLFVIPGNHDDREEMRLAFSDQPYMPKQGFLHYAIEAFPIRLIGLDTHVKDEGRGHLCEERLFWLKETLNMHPDKPTFLFMHHPPILTGVTGFDAITCTSAPGFEELIRKSNQILGIAAGHFHHLCLGAFGGKFCFLAPSIAPVHYFVHPDDNFVTALELEDPAITLYRYQGGALAAHVIRLKDDYRRIDWAIIEARKVAQSQSCTK